MAEIRLITPPPGVVPCRPDYPFGHHWQPHINRWAFPSATPVSVEVVFRCLICDYHVSAQLDEDP